MKEKGFFLVKWTVYVTRTQNLPPICKANKQNTAVYKISIVRFSQEQLMIEIDIGLNLLLG